MKRMVRSAAMFSVLFFAHVCVANPQATPQPQSPSPKADPLPSVDEIAAKCAKGSGGKEAWAKLSTLVMTGTMEIPAASLTGKIEVYAKAPNKTLRIVTLADGQFVQKEAFDGKAGWKSDPQTGLKRLEGAELETAKMESAFDTEVRLKEIYPDMKVTGRAKVGDRDAYTVLTHEPGGKTLTFYFDAQTGVRIAEDSEAPDQSGQVQKTSIFFEDYRPLGGVQIPYRIRGDAASFSFVIRIQDARYNTPVDDAMFAMPAASPSPTSPQ